MTSDSRASSQQAKEKTPAIIRLGTEIGNQLQSPLLQLPGEIRNRIYEYVIDNNVGEKNLYADEGHFAFMIPRKPSAGLLKSRKSKASKSKGAAAYSNKFDILNQIGEQPDETQPAYRQDIIPKTPNNYPCALHYLEDGTDRWDQRDRYHELNPLKLVCRKLYLETRNLCGRTPLDSTDTLTFPRFRDNTAPAPYSPKPHRVKAARRNPQLQSFARFIRQCKPERLANLRTLNVEMFWPDEGPWQLEKPPGEAPMLCHWAFVTLAEALEPLLKELLPLLAKGTKPEHQWELLVQGGPGFFGGLTFIQEEYDTEYRMPWGPYSTVRYRRREHEVGLPEGMPEHLRLVGMGEKEVEGEPGVYEAYYLRDRDNGDVVFVLN